MENITTRGDALRFLVKKINVSIKSRDTDSLQKAIDILETVPGANMPMVLKYKCHLYELYMDGDNLDNAIKGFETILKAINKNTRLYLEALSLLAISNIRSGGILIAEPLIREVLANIKAIRTIDKRIEFHKEIIERFKEEGVLFGLKTTINQDLRIDEIEEQVKLLGQMTESDLYYQLGNAIPDESLIILLRIDNYSKNLLPGNERKLLPAPLVANDKENIGKSLFASLKRTLYNAICDPKSDLHKLWSTGSSNLIKASFVAGIVLFEAKAKGIAIKSLITFTVALLLRVGIEWYCTHTKPLGVLEIRN